MKNIFIALIMLLALTASAQRTVENPTVGARSMGACTGFFIDKIELKDNATKLYLTNYHGYKEGWFRIASGTTLRAGDKKWQVTSAEGIDLDTQVYPKDDVEFVTHFVLNFPAIDKNLETIDFYESDDLNSYILYDIALTDRAAEQIKKRIAFPEELRNYQLNIKDSGESLEQNGFSMTPATVKGRIYGYDKRTFGERMDNSVTVHIYDPFLRDQLSFSSKINDDGSFEVHVPMTTKHQAVYFAAKPIISNNILISAGKTVEVNFDFQQIYKPWELPNSRLIPYFAGENVDINFALSNDIIRAFYRMFINGNPDVYKKYANLTLAQYKDYILDAYDKFNMNVIEVSPFSKRAKEFLKISLKSETADLLSMGEHELEDAYRVVNGKAYNDPIPDYKKPEMEPEYLDYPKTLGIDDAMMFYATRYGYNIAGWEMRFNRIFKKYTYIDSYSALYVETWEKLPTVAKKMSKKEKSLAADYVKKLRAADPQTLQNEFIAAIPLAQNTKDIDAKNVTEESELKKKYAGAIWALILDDIRQKEAVSVAKFDDYFGAGDSYLKDFIKLQSYCQPLNRQTVVPDSIIAEIEKMRFPFYAEYVKAKNAEVTAKIAAEKSRGGYHVHQAGESEGDSLFVDLIKDFKGKVVFVDFWNTWCAPCRMAIKEMEPMEKYFEGKDVVFLFLADESSPQKEYDGMIVSMKGEHYRLTESQSSSLKQKWGFTGIPSYVIVGRDGMVKDFHTGFHGVEYYKQKIEEELNK